LDKKTSNQPSKCLKIKKQTKFKMINDRNSTNTNPYFTRFDEPIAADSLPQKLNSPFGNVQSPICLLAIEKLQHYLVNQKDWTHNFGLDAAQTGAIIGKMFGVLVVKTEDNELGYLAAFSGKLAGRNQHLKFVPPVFDTLQADSFLTEGMTQLSAINLAIKTLQSQSLVDEIAVKVLKNRRKSNSMALQDKLFDQYHFLNKALKSKSLRDIFSDYANRKPPSAAGECAAPKLFQYAFQNKMIPIAIAEFWWGLSPKSAFWQHKQFYPACQEKCAPILTFMLKDVLMGK
jgi:tRNA pseudouridine32 synthase / 23S rRNA pseudouridine746 synthase